MRRTSAPLYALALASGVALGIVFVSALVFSDSDGAKDAAPTPVLVATQLIPAGIPGERVLRQEMYVQTTVPRWQLQDGAIGKPVSLCGRVVATDVFPGQQFTAVVLRPPLEQTISSRPSFVRVLASGVWVDSRGRFLRPPCGPGIR